MSGPRQRTADLDRQIVVYLAEGAGQTPAEWAMTIATLSSASPPPDGARLVTLKEVDFTDEIKTEWLVRNRTTLKRLE